MKTMPTFSLKKKTNICRLSILVISCLAFPLAAQLASWTPTSLSNYGPSPWAASSTSSNMTVGGWIRGSGVGTSGTAASNAWGGNGWGGASNQDMTFTITSNPGSIASYTAFNLYYRRSTTGPASGTLEYTFGSSTTYSVIGNFTFSSTNSSGASHAPISLTGVSNLQNVPSGTVVKFRIFPAAGTSTAGTWYIYSTGASIAGTISNFGVNISQLFPITCHGQSNAGLTATVTGGTPPYTYSWMPSGGTFSTATNLSAGVYTCFVTGAASETTISTFTVTQPAALTLSLIGQTNVGCHGSSNGSATVSASGGLPGYSFNWLPGSGTGSVGTNLTAGTYTISILDTNNCSASQTLSIVQPPSFLVAYASNSVICKDATVSVNAAGADTYTWTGGLTNGAIFSASSTAIYTVSGTNTLTGCTESTTVSLIVNPHPVITPTVVRSGAICIGETNTLTVTGALTYTWSTTSTSSLIVISPTTNTTYTVTGTDGNNCVSTSTVLQKISNCTGISSIDLDANNSINLFPNPNAGEFTIKTDYDVSLIVINDLAQIVQTLELNVSNNRTRTVTELKSGIYFIRSANGQLNRKVIVTK